MSEKTDVDHWNNAWARKPRPRLPTGLDIGTHDLQRLLKRFVKPEMHFLEVGCAPGKMLAWVNKVLGANVSGVDYSPRGVEVTKWLLETLKIPADIRRENIFSTSFESESFDIVYSCGLIEHFDDPRDIVAAHVKLVRKGGLALIIVPNYGGLYGKLQRRFDPENLSIHNLEIMNESAMRELAPAIDVTEVDAYLAGHLSPWLVSWERSWGVWGKALSFTINGIAFLQPIKVRSLCSWLVLEIRRAAD